MDLPNPRLWRKRSYRAAFSTLLSTFPCRSEYCFSACQTWQRSFHISLCL